MPDLWDNPMGTDGFEFVEYAAPDPQLLRSLFEQMGFPRSPRHRQKNVTLYKQGDINFVINAEPDSFAQRFASSTDRAPARWRFVWRTRGASSTRSSRAPGLSSAPRPDGIEHSGDRRNRGEPPSIWSTATATRHTHLRHRLRPLPGFEAFWAGKRRRPAASA